MWRRLLRWIFSFLLTSPLLTAVAQAQAPGEPIERRPPAPEYAFAFLVTLIALVMICMPARKR